MNLSEAELKECRPYDDSEFKEGLKRILSHPSLPKIVMSLFPGVTGDDFLKMAGTIQTTESFQEKVISKAIASILNLTTRGLETHGLQNISQGKKYLFISNHRDIICDSALLTSSLLLNGFTTPKICLGDNLLVNQLTVDLVKMNKGIIVKRNLPMRDLFKWSQALSELIRQQIELGIDSVWIAQREGRAKDGNDSTHPGVIKMLTLTGKGTLPERLRSLNVVPVAISYEYDPCDIMKAKELYFKSVNGSYQKSPDEDLRSMMAGIEGFKGRIHIEVGVEITHAIETAKLLDTKKDQLAVLVNEIDRQIHQSYKNWPTNFIAYDLLEGKGRLKDRYTENEKKKFIDRMENRLLKLQLNKTETDGIRHFFLKSYSNSIKDAG